MAAIHRVSVPALVGAALALGGCSTTPVRYFKGPPSPEVAGADLSSALGYLNNARGQYQHAVEGQMKDERGVANALVGAGALVVALAVGGASTNVIAGTTLLAGTAYGLGNLNLPRQRVLVHLAGVEALSCAQKAVTPLVVTPDRWKAIAAAVEPLRQSQSALNGALFRGKAFSTVPPSDEGKKLTQALDAGTQVRQASDATLAQARDFLQSGHRLVSAVNGIDEAVVRSLVSATPELTAVPGLVSGLAGLAGSFAPGAGVETFLTGKLGAVLGTQGGDTSKTTATEKSPLLTAAEEIVKAATATVQLSAELQSLLPTQVQWPEDAFKNCGVGPVVSALSVSEPSLQFTAGVDAQRSFEIQGGVKPYFVRLDGSPIDGLTVRSPVRFDNQFDVGVVGSKVTTPMEARIRIVDSSPSVRSLNVPLVVAAAPAAPPAVVVPPAPTAEDPVAADLEKIKNKGQFKLAGRTYLLTGVPARNGNSIEVRVACPSGNPPPAKRTDLAQALLKEAGITEPPKRDLRISTVPPACAVD